MKRCRTCKWWDKLPAPKTLGLCRNPEKYATPKYHWGDFGSYCAHWQSKKPLAPKAKVR